MRSTLWMAFLVLVGVGNAVAPALRGTVTVNGVPLPAGWHIVWMGVIGATVVFGVRLGRSCVTTTDTEVVVRNALSTHRVRWRDITGFDVGPRSAHPPAHERSEYLRVVRTDGTFIACQGVPRRGALDSRIDGIVLELDALLTEHRSSGAVGSS